MTCANLCLGNAISFPALDALHALYKREGIWAKVKNQMTEEGALVENNQKPSEHPREE